MHYPIRMSRHTLFQRVQHVALGLCAVVLFVAVAMPHRHDDASVSHKASSCRACKLQEGFVATPPPAALAALPTPAIEYAVVRTAQSHRGGTILRVFAPRAPPLPS